MRLTGWLSKFLIVSVLSFADASATSYAAQGITDTDQVTVTQSLRGICGDIYAQTKANDNPEQYTFAYEKKLYLAAHINFAQDSRDSATEKLQRLWTKNPVNFQCSALNFSVPGGNIAKYAIEMRTFDFVESMFTSWKLNVNIIDGADCKTLLDFVEVKLDQNRGGHLEPVLKGYRDRLISYGALRSSQISASERAAQKRVWLDNWTRLKSAGLAEGTSVFRCS